MILIDTVVVAEALRASPRPDVIRWLDAQEPETVFLSTISVAELLREIARLRPSKRETARGAKMSDMALELFEDRVLPFDLPAARHCGRIMTEVRSSGYSISRRDCFIAATAASLTFRLQRRRITRTRFWRRG